MGALLTDYTVQNNLVTGNFQFTGNFLAATLSLAGNYLFHHPGHLHSKTFACSHSLLMVSKEEGGYQDPLALQGLAVLALSSSALALEL